MVVSFTMFCGISTCHVSFNVTYVRIIGGRLIYQLVNNHVVEKHSLTRVHDIEVKP